MGVLNNKIDELNRLEKQYKQERDRVIQAIENVVRGVGQNPAIKPTSKNTFIINISEMMDTPWSPEFHDWTIQAERLLTVLKKKPVKQWIAFINELLDVKTKPGWQAIMIDKIQLNRRFLLQIKEQL
ncbi:MAG: hypothetical protein LUD40_08015 [Phocaeicola dorei]|nr:hypothetical protein [Phocaeicola dorei]